MTPHRPLIGTYRLQLRPGFGFPDATRVLPYLSALGVSHVYLSPCFEADRGSMHGYDVVDPTRIREELGGEQAFRELAAEADRLGLGLVLDIVPHHMSTAGDQNPWWWDVLMLGRTSRYARHFDIDWEPPEEKLRDTVLLPVLGDHYGRVLEAGDLAIEWTTTGRFQVRYFDTVVPLSPAAVGTIVERAAGRAGSDELGLVGRVLQCTERTAAESDAGAIARDADIRTAEREVARLSARDPGIAAAIDAELEQLNADVDALDEVLSTQHYRVARWQVGSHELDYRRFFDITTLVALRSEREEVFRDTHALATALVADGTVDGLRVDHPDGLLDPQGYFERLRAAVGPGTWILGEKILRAGERVPVAWPIDGTTGYDFLHHATGVLVDPAGLGRLRDAYARFTGEPTDYDAIRLATRRQVLHAGLAADLERLSALLVRVCERQRRYRDFTRSELREAIAEVAAHAPAYRSYVRGDGGRLTATDDDVRFIEAALTGAATARPDIDPELLALLGDVLNGRIEGDVEAAFARRFQQLTGPVAAKGEEDTAFYSAVWLLALNEVGSGPEHEGVRPDELHAHNALMQERWPTTMLATSTHDTKRSEDVRARLALVSERPEAWSDAVVRWAGLNDRFWSGDAPDRRTEWFVYQTLVGAHPLSLDRLWTVLEKSVREAKDHTSWLRPDESYETALRRFVEGALGNQPFLDDLERFATGLVVPGRVNSLALAVLTLLSPGVPDRYQGCELWDDSLVDPDNRRAVDFDVRRRYLNELGEHAGPVVWRDRQDTGLPKLLVLRECLTLRRAHQGAFGPGGTYEPLTVAGDERDHAIAFLRGTGVVAIVPRLVGALDGRPPRARVAIPGGTWINVFTGDAVDGGEVDLERLLATFPVAVLLQHPFGD